LVTGRSREGSVAGICGNWDELTGSIKGGVDTFSNCQFLKEENGVAFVSAALESSAVTAAITSNINICCRLLLCVPLCTE
jgi:hypothetical protein